MKVLVIIPTYNERENIERILPMLRQMSPHRLITIQAVEVLP